MPLAIDLFCGLGGWTEGLLAEGYNVIGFDIEQHIYGDMRYPGKLVLQDILTLHGSQFKDADLIVASPPCQEYSYMAMPWKLAKAKAKAIRADTTGASLERLNLLFNSCFRIQKEASIAAGKHIPIVIENVRGAQPWIGRAKWNFGSFYLWGDVPALMPQTVKAQKFNPDGTNHGQGSWFAIADSKNRGTKNPGFRFDGSGKSFQSESVNRHVVRDDNKTPHGNCSEPLWKDRPIARYAHATPEEIEAHGFKVPTNGKGRRTDKGKGARFTSRDCGLEDAGRKIGGDWFSDPKSTCRKHGSKSPARKMASTMIAKIPFVLSRHIAAVYKPREIKP